MSRGLRTLAAQMPAAEPSPESAATAAPAPAGEEAPPRGDRLLAALFWAWAAVLLLATLAQLFGWEGVLDVLDVKRWFAR